MKRIVLISAIAILALSVGCRRAANDLVHEGEAQVTFAMNLAQADAEATVEALQSKAATDPLPKDSRFRATVYLAGDVTSPIASEVYVIADETGKASPVDPKKMVTLKAGTYDFYFHSVETLDADNDKNVATGTEAFASGKQTVDVIPAADGKETVVNVTLRRMHALLTMVIKPLASESGVTSLSLRDQMSIYYLPGTGTFDVIGAKVTADATLDYIANMPISNFFQNPNLEYTTRGSSIRGVAVLPGTIADLKVDLPLTVNGAAKLYHVDLTNVTFEAGKYYTLNVEIGIKGECEAIIQPWTSQVQAPEMGDLILDYTSQPANCYVVYPINGVYPKLRFNALKKPVAKYVKGSSTIANAPGSNPASATDPRLGDDIVYQTGDYVQVVWNSTANYGNSYYFLPSRYSVLPDGVVTVTTNGEGTGNAVLAYKRADGTILWNYHIWGTETNPFVTHATANTGGSVNGTAEGGAQAKFMDRNLGALAATATKPSTTDAYKYFGLLYQYGRPTPFTGQGESSTLNTYTQLYDQNGNQISKNNIGGFTVQANIAVDDMTTAIKNPRNWYYKSISNYTWYGFGNVALWSDYGTNKSVYDPCPYGYRVPKSGSWNGFASQTFTTAIDGGAVSFGTWWPAAGFRWYDYDIILNRVGQYGRYWSSSMSTTTSFSYYFLFYSASVENSPEMHRSGGLTIRCVQEGY